MDAMTKLIVKVSAALVLISLASAVVFVSIAIALSTTGDRDLGGRHPFQRSGRAL
jgi:hypothetical protein